MEDLFGLAHLPDLAADPDYVQRCRALSERRGKASPSSSSSSLGAYASASDDDCDDARTWKFVLERATEAVAKATDAVHRIKPDIGTTNSPAGDSAFLLRLHRRAISRTLQPSHGVDALDVWLSCAACQLQHGLFDEARWTLLHVEPGGGAGASSTSSTSFPQVARYYQARADWEMSQERTSAAMEVLQRGLDRGAEPRVDLERRLAALQASQPASEKVLANTTTVPFKSDNATPPASAGEASSSQHKRPLQQPSALPALLVGARGVSPKRFKRATAEAELAPLSSAVAAAAVTAPTIATTETSTDAPLLPILPRPYRRQPLGLLSLPPLAGTIAETPIASRPAPALDEEMPQQAPALAAPNGSAPAPAAGVTPIATEDRTTPGRPPLAQHTKSFLPTTAASSLSRRPLWMRATQRTGSLGLPQRVDPHCSPLGLADRDGERHVSNDGGDTTTTTVFTTTQDDEGATQDTGAMGSATTAKPPPPPAEESTTRSSDSTGKTPPRKVQLDISYMWDWDPQKAPPTRTRTSCSSPSLSAMESKLPPSHGCGEGESDQGESISGETGRDSSKAAAMADPSPTSPRRRATAVLSQAPTPLSQLGPSPDGTLHRDSPAATSRAFRSELSNNDDAAALLAKTNLDFLPLVRHDNILKVNGVSYVKLGVIGKGGSCKVYRALSRDCSVVAIKKVKLSGMDHKAVSGYANEIALLKRLRGNPAIIQMYDSEVDLKRKAIFVVMEQGETDLNHVLQQQQILVPPGSGGRRSDIPAQRHLNMNFVRLTWHQMLGAVHCIHEARIVHGDLKPANFLFVKGALKLIDFGIAKAIQSDDTTNIYRESQIGTLNYMSPEAICDTGTGNGGLRMKIGRVRECFVKSVTRSLCMSHSPSHLLSHDAGTHRRQTCGP